VQAHDGMVRGYAYKPDEPTGNLVANEVFVFGPDPLLETLEELAREAGDDDLDDLGDEVLPRLVADGAARESRFTGYWRDVGTVDAYFECHQELLDEPPPIDLDDPSWPVLTRAPARHASARVLPEAAVSGSMLAPGATVAGTVERTVIGRGALIEAGAVVRDSVVLPGAIVRSGAEVVRAVLDDGVRIGRGAAVGAPDGAIALVGMRSEVDDEEVVAAGARYPG
jgi:glucose-1-phosphate adenylyltransferase